MMSSPIDFKSEFLLDPGIHFLNHGSFGACPRRVFEVYQDWQRQLERHPVKLLGREIYAELDKVRQALGAYVKCAPDDLVFFPNPSTAINMVVRSLPLGPGDEVLSTDHEYGAMDRTWRFLSGKMGFKYVSQPISIPAGPGAAIVDQLFAGLSPNTRAVFVSHMTSQTALTFPVKEICRRAKSLGLITIVDGAHAPGHLPLELESLGADLYTGACHKWLCAPKGAAFLYAARAIQPTLNPLVVSWGYEAEIPRGSQFQDYHDWQGTRDYSAILTIPQAIEFCSSTEWVNQKERCRAIARDLWQELIHEFPFPAIYSKDSQFSQMFAIELPVADPVDFQARLLETHNVEVPVYSWQGKTYLRVSVQAYNDQADIDALRAGLHEFLPSLHHPA